jgi:hypothetical protein
MDRDGLVKTNQPGKEVEGRMSNPTQTIALRTAQPSNGPALNRLATLDSAKTPAGQALLAEVDGELRAAVSLETGQAVADPFRPTADLVALLAVAATATRRPGSRVRRRLARPARVPVVRLAA